MPISFRLKHTFRKASQITFVPKSWSYNVDEIDSFSTLELLGWFEKTKNTWVLSSFESGYVDILILLALFYFMLKFC